MAPSSAEGAVAGHATRHRELTSKGGLFNAFARGNDNVYSTAEWDIQPYLECTAAIKSNAQEKRMPTVCIRISQQAIVE